MKKQINILLIISFFSFGLQIQYNEFKLEYSYQTNDRYKIVPYFLNV